MCLSSVSELCGMDLYDKEAQANNPKLEGILLACRQLYQAGLLESIFQSMVWLYFSFLKTT